MIADCSRFYIDAAVVVLVAVVLFLFGRGDASDFAGGASPMLPPAEPDGSPVSTAPTAQRVVASSPMLPSEPS